MVVIDASAVLGLALDDESAAFALRVTDEVQRGGGVSPSIFWYELRNNLVINERRGRIAPNNTLNYLNIIGELAITLAPIAEDQVVLDLARRLNLTVYDAAYLEVALRFQAPLATLDRRLREATSAAGAQIFS